MKNSATIALIFCITSILILSCFLGVSGEIPSNASVLELRYTDVSNVFGIQKAHHHCQGIATNHNTNLRWKKCKLGDKIHKKEITQFPCALSCFEAAIGFLSKDFRPISVERILIESIKEKNYFPGKFIGGLALALLNANCRDKIDPAAPKKECLDVAESSICVLNAFVRYCHTKNDEDATTEKIL